MFAHSELTIVRLDFWQLNYNWIRNFVNWINLPRLLCTNLNSRWMTWNLSPISKVAKNQSTFAKIIKLNFLAQIFKQPATYWDRFLALTVPALGPPFTPLGANLQTCHQYQGLDCSTGETPLSKGYKPCYSHNSKLPPKALRKPIDRNSTFRREHNSIATGCLLDANGWR